MLAPLLMSDETLVGKLRYKSAGEVDYHTLERKIEDKSSVLYQDGEFSSSSSLSQEQLSSVKANATTQPTSAPASPQNTSAELSQGDRVTTIGGRKIIVNTDAQTIEYEDEEPNKPETLSSSSNAAEKPSQEARTTKIGGITITHDNATGKTLVQRSQDTPPPTALQALSQGETPKVPFDPKGMTKSEFSLDSLGLEGKKIIFENNFGNLDITIIDRETNRQAFTTSGTPKDTINTVNAYFSEQGIDTSWDWKKMQEPLAGKRTTSASKDFHFEGEELVNTPSLGAVFAGAARDVSPNLLMERFAEYSTAATLSSEKVSKYVETNFADTAVQESIMNRLKGALDDGKLEIKEMVKMIADEGGKAPSYLKPDSQLLSAARDTVKKYGMDDQSGSIATGLAKSMMVASDEFKIKEGKPPEFLQEKQPELEPLRPATTQPSMGMGMGS